MVLEEGKNLVEESVSFMETREALFNFYIFPQNELCKTCKTSEKVEGFYPGY